MCTNTDLYITILIYEFIFGKLEACKLKTGQEGKHFVNQNILMSDAPVTDSLIFQVYSISIIPHYFQKTHGYMAV